MNQGFEPRGKSELLASERDILINPRKKLRPGRELQGPGGNCSSILFRGACGQLQYQHSAQNQ